MTRGKILTAIGVIEILIGAITISATTFSVMAGTNAKTPNVLGFVLLTSFLSTALGIGTLRRRKAACDLLVYFSSVIVLSKVLIFAGIITLNGALEASVPASFKNSISILYHCFVIFYLCRDDVKKLF